MAARRSHRRRRLASAAAVLVGAAFLASPGAAIAGATVPNPERTAIAPCAALRASLAAVPAAQARTAALIARLERELGRTRRPAARAVIEARLARLRALERSLADKVARARASCPTLSTGPRRA